MLRPPLMCSHRYRRLVAALTIVAALAAGSAGSSASAAVAPSPTLTPDAVDFGAAQVGESTGPVEVTLANDGPGTLTFWRFGIASSSVNAGDFLIVDGGSCSTSVPLAPGEGCTVLVRFRPLAAGDRSGKLSFWVNTASGRIDAMLAGTSSDGPTPSFSPAAVDFGGAQVGESSDPVAVTLSNDGPGTLTFWRFGIASSSVNAADFRVVDGGSCSTSAPVAAGESCTVLVRFKPTGAGARSGLLSFWVNTRAGRIDAALSGTASDAPSPSLTPGGVNFGTVEANHSSAPVAVTLSNAGPGVLTFWRFGISTSSRNPTDFRLVDGGTCSTSVPLAPGESCTVLVRLKPVGIGTRSAVLSFWVNTPAGRIDATLTGFVPDPCPNGCL
jgi:hypothetical protein